ncbi:MAG: hypothetical protein ACLTA5_10175 [Anaerococcus obesiensis]
MNLKKSIHFYYRPYRYKYTVNYLKDGQDKFEAVGSQGDKFENVINLKFLNGNRHFDSVNYRKSRVSN